MTVVVVVEMGLRRWPGTREAGPVGAGGAGDPFPSGPPHPEGTKRPESANVYTTDSRRKPRKCVFETRNKNLQDKRRW